MRRIAFMIALLLIASAAAQGPAPGHNPLSYAQAYADDKVNQTGDAEQFVRDHGSVNAVENETSHALWLACWSAYDVTGEVTSPVCAQFFTPPVTVEPTQPEENVTEEVLPIVANVTDTIHDLIGNVTNGTDLGFLDHLKDIVGTVGDGLGAILDFVVASITFVVDTLVLIVKGILGILVAMGIVSLYAGDMLDGVVAGLTGALVGAVVWIASGIGSGVLAALDGIGRLASTIGGGLVSALAALGSGIATATNATGDAIATAAQGLGDAAKAVGSGIADAAGAVGDAISSAIDSVQDAVQKLFGAESTEAAPLRELPEVDTEDPIRTITEILPETSTK